MKGTFLVVRHYPDRKKPCLVIEQGNTGIVLATFRNEACAELFNYFLGEGKMCLYRGLEEDMGAMYDVFKESEAEDGNDD